MSDPRQFEEQHTRIAAELIDSISVSYPWAATEIVAALPLLRPTEYLIQTDEVFRAHAREILTRIVNNSDTRPLTEAEMLAMLWQAVIHEPSNLVFVNAKRTRALIFVAACRIHKRIYGEWPDVIGTSREHVEKVPDEPVEKFLSNIKTQTPVVWRKIG